MFFDYLYMKHSDNTVRWHKMNRPKTLTLASSPGCGRDLFPYTYVYNEERYVGGIVYFTVLCDHPYLVSLLFAVLVSLHPVTFLNVFDYLFMSFFLAAGACLS